MTVVQESSEPAMSVGIESVMSKCDFAWVYRSKPSVVEECHDINRLIADLRNNAKAATISRKARSLPEP